MDSPDTLVPAQEVLSPSEVERLVAQTSEQESKTDVLQNTGGTKPQHPDHIQPYDFRHPVFLSPSELRKLRVQHEEFIRSLSARLSLYLRLEVGLQMSQLQTLTYQKFTESIGSPCHLTLFKVEPLRGICILDIRPRLGLTIVDRLMGGLGQSVTANRDLSEIEVSLLDQAIDLMISEWCNHWAEIQALRPTLLGHDNSGRFLQTSTPDAIVLILSIEVQLGDCVESIQFTFPYNTIEPLIHRLSAKLDTAGDDLPTVSNTQTGWRPCLEDVRVPISAQWQGLELTARQLTELKIGDVLPLPARFAEDLGISLGKMKKFMGQLGTVDNRWAVELTSVLKS